eukprot:gene11447-12801_t
MLLVLLIFQSFLQLYDSYPSKYLSNGIKPHYPQHHHHHSGNNLILHSLGDPDLSTKSDFYRKWQDFARRLDQVLSPADPDCPGLTFFSPIVWAPWMETIWFGNYYDYRSGFFHDVMYSNNKPDREGALLFKDPLSAQQVAMLYQRYPKFDETSYSLSNATFYNLFAAQNLRMGKYKIPLSQEVVLCLTDPLTFTEMRRYFVSWPPTKWFFSQFLQQKRKRQYPMTVPKLSGGGKGKARSGYVSYEENFFAAAVHKVEYSRLENHLATRGLDQLPATIPTISGLVEEGLCDVSSDGVVSVPAMVANSQHFFETLFQSIYSVVTRKNNEVGDVSKVKVLVGGDGRLLNDFATEILLRVGAGNGVDEIVVAEGHTLTTAMATSLLPALHSPHQVTLAIVMTAGEAEGGLAGKWGMQLLRYDPQTSSSVHAWSKQEIEEVLSYWQSCHEFKVAPARLSPSRLAALSLPATPSRHGQQAVASELSGQYLQTQLTSLPASHLYNDYLVEDDLLRCLLDEVEVFLSREEVFHVVDASHGIALPVLFGSTTTTTTTTIPTIASTKQKNILAAKLFLSKDNLIRSDPRVEVVSIRKTSSLSSSSSSQQGEEVVVNLSEDMADLFSIDSSSSSKKEDENEESRYDDCPDIGFILSPNLDHCEVVFPGLVVARPVLMGLLKNYWTSLLSTSSHRESEKALFRTIFARDSSEERLLPVDRGLAILMATLLVLANGHGSSKKASSSLLSERFASLVQQFSSIEGGG